MQVNSTKTILASKMLPLGLTNMPLHEVQCKLMVGENTRNKTHQMAMSL